MHPPLIPNRGLPSDMIYVSRWQYKPYTHSKAVQWNTHVVDDGRWRMLSMSFMVNALDGGLEAISAIWWAESSDCFCFIE